MQRTHPEILSLRKIKRSFSETAPVTTEEQRDFVMVECDNKLQKPFPPCQHLDKGPPFHTMHSRNQSVLIEENTEYQRQKKPSSSLWRRCLTVFLVVVATLGASVALSYFVAINVRNKDQQSGNDAIPLQMSNLETHIAEPLRAQTEPPALYQIADNPQDRPEIEMVLDMSCKEDDSDILKWKHPDGVIGFKHNLVYERGYFVLPLAGRYDVHMTLGIEVAYINLNETIGLNICVSKGSPEVVPLPLRCSRVRVPHNWAGKVSVDIFRMSFDKDDTLLTTISSGYGNKTKLKQVFRTEPTESHVKMFYVL